MLVPFVLMHTPCALAIVSPIFSHGFLVSREKREYVCSVSILPSLVPFLISLFPVIDSLIVIGGIRQYR